MSRTRFTKTKKRFDSKQQYQSLILPIFEERSDDIIVEVNDYTRLDVLANRFFNDATLWWVISAYNQLPADSIYTTDKKNLRIPNNIQTVFNKIKDLN